MPTNHVGDADFVLVAGAALSRCGHIQARSDDNARHAAIHFIPARSS